MPSSQHSCQLGKLFKRCPQPVIASCVYCGRWFCADHGNRHGEGMDICSRKRCQLKADDLVGHQGYLQRGGERNGYGLCALEGCESRYSASCSRCSLFFCEEHVAIREDRMAISKDEAVFSTCEHCWQRRALWRRRG